MGVIVLIVVAALDPIEQFNRGRDASYRTSAQQIVQASERYFAARGKYQWVGDTGGPTSNASSMGFVNATNSLIGICGANCTSDGDLITSQELKGDFRKKDFLKTTASPRDRIAVGKEAGSNISVYACYVPRSHQEQNKGCTAEKVYTLSPTNGTKTPLTTPCEPGDPWPTAAPLWYLCVPE